jgi:hypothetical protein
MESVMAVLIRYSGEVRVRGGIRHVSIRSLPVDKCSECNEIYFTTRTDEAISNHLKKVNPNAFR